MSKKVDYTEAADWSESDAKDNVEYYLSRGRVFEVEEIARLRGVSWDDLTSEGPPEVFPQPEPASATAMDPNAVPSGTVDDVLDWVGTDPVRAQAALDAEDSGKQRSTLMEALQATVDEG